MELDIFQFDTLALATTCALKQHLQHGKIINKYIEGATGVFINN